MQHWTREDLAWAGGFLEGEGSFRANTSRRENGKSWVTLTVDVVQVNREPLEKLLQIFPFGKIYGPYTHSGKGTRLPHYRYIVHSLNTGQAIIAAIWPWLSAKRRTQATNAIKAVTQKGTV
jgi:hypothetical protein